ncbi:MAG: hypothetical protein AB7S38_36925 [Vulcanimicrobiota bacterium]
MSVKLKPGLITSDCGEETLVYDPSSRTAHLLDPTATLAFQVVASGCEPGESFEEAIGRLDEAGLVVDFKTRSGISRRKLLKAALAPMVLTIAAPKPAVATSIDCAVYTVNNYSQQQVCVDLCGRTTGTLDVFFCTNNNDCSCGPNFGTVDCTSTTQSLIPGTPATSYSLAGAC